MKEFHHGFRFTACVERFAIVGEYGMQPGKQYTQQATNLPPRLSESFGSGVTLMGQSKLYSHMKGVV